MAKVFGVVNRSAQLPISISITGSRMVNTVMPKLGRACVALTPSSSSVNCTASGFTSGSFT
ncbi:hypothetical protein D3C86_2067330 [compost metagenome]